MEAGKRRLAGDMARAANSNEVQQLRYEEEMSQEGFCRTEAGTSPSLEV